MLLDHGACVHAEATHKYETPLFYACQEGHLEVIELLLQHGALEILQNDSPDSQYLDKILNAGITNERFDVVRLLLENIADFHVKRQCANNVLLDACHTGNTELAQTVLDHGADVNFTSPLSPLYQACSQGSVALVDLLMRAGAAIQVDGEKSTLLHAACRSGCVGVA